MSLFPDTVLSSWRPTSLRVALALWPIRWSASLKADRGMLSWSGLRMGSPSLHLVLGPLQVSAVFRARDGSCVDEYSGLHQGCDHPGGTGPRTQLSLERERRLLASMTPHERRRWTADNARSSWS